MKKTLESLAAEAFEGCSGDRAAAIPAFVGLLEQHPELRQQALSRLGRLLIGELTRALHFTQMQTRIQDIAPKVRAALGGILNSWALSNGKLLRDAQRPDLLAEIARLQSQVTGLVSRIAFLQALANKLPNDEAKVCEVTTEAEVSTMIGPQPGA